MIWYVLSHTTILRLDLHCSHCTDAGTEVKKLVQGPWKGPGHFQGLLDHLGEPLPYTALWILALEDIKPQINCRQSFLLKLKSTLSRKNTVSKRGTKGLKQKANPGRAGTRKGGSGPGSKQLSEDCGVWDSISQGQQLLLRPGKSYCAGTQAEPGSCFSWEIRNLGYFPPLETSEFLSFGS